MKVAGSALVHILCGVALASEPTGNQQQHAPTQVLLAASTGRLVPRAQHIYKRKNREDPANPVAAAATDPNEAAIMIKSRDLIPTDRPNFHPDVHRHRHGDQDDDDSSGGNDDDDSHSGHKKGSAGKSKAKGSSSKAGRNDENDDDNNDDGDGDGDDDSDSHAQKGKNGKKDKGDKDSKAKGKGKDKDKGDKDKAGSKQKSKGKGDDDKKNKKKKNTHTGLDGNEVDNDDDEDGQGKDPKHKKVKVKHVEAKQRHWRTGKPNYNYKKSLAGWKEVGPLYYFKGKYENAASSTIASHGARHVLLPAALAMGFAFAPFF
ncbi:hypothetical protein LPJ59_004296 [Coemansia sp. RSA 2399]|nr:hypothetical protein LPJ59_004296 [Coemansia sp. RSA 2399]KAJ1900025.1 hypothetical protein LPJ81_004024 [Coemansia sp. IMI 209127]